MMALLKVCVLVFAISEGCKARILERDESVVDGWSESRAEIIKEKLITLWDSQYKYTTTLVDKHFEDKDSRLVETSVGAKNGEWLYDPTEKLTTLDCSDVEDLCRTYWSDKRTSNLAFSETKAIRLAFHDCVPYEDGTGGCDGCINFDDNLIHNNVLQPSVALLEQIYLDKDFPTTSNLDDSPKNLGMSRADLWAFAGLVALDRIQSKTDEMCAKNSYNYTCNDWDSPCYSPFPNKALKLFKTGRPDCEPKYPGTKWEYVATKAEVEPDRHGNGPTMAKYFGDNFGLSPRQGLALMGAHTVGQFSTFAEHIDYAWVRGQGEDSRNELWNNEYYKTLVGNPSHVKDKYCTGNMDGSAPEHTWAVRANLFESYWPQGEPWIDRPRRLLWNHLVTRSPTCEEAEEDGLGNGGKFWDGVDCQRKEKCKNSGIDFKLDPENHFWEYCCKQKQDECWKTNSCDEECTRTVQNRIRHLGSDVGFYLKFEYDEKGYPKKVNDDGSSCDAFKDIGPYDWKYKWTFDDDYADSMSMKYVNDNDDGKTGEEGRIAGCPLQDMLDGDMEKDGHSQEMYKTVQMYADDQSQWLSDFSDAWEIMSSNGCSDLHDGPQNFWSTSFAE